MKIQSAALMFIVVALASCSPMKVPFTQQIREKNELSAEELKKLQFYTSNTLILRRGENRDTSDIENGELTIRKDGVVDEVVIKGGTPCIVKDVIDGNQVSVIFGDGANRYLVFGSLRNKDGYYTLQAYDWNKDRGKVNYGEKVYYSSANSRNVFLTFKMKNLKQIKVNQKVVKGAKVS
jgi:hypothetical protein